MICSRYAGSPRGPRAKGVKRLSKVESLYGTTPAEIFQSGVENIGEIEAVAAAVLWRDGRVTAGWSNAEIGDLARMILTLDEDFRRKNLRGGDD